MKHGDFTNLAKKYINRPGYSEEVLSLLCSYIGIEENDIIADVGAGTGKLTENLNNIGMKGYAVEPNDAMREEGIKLFTGNKNFKWMKGTAEQTKIDDSSVKWVIMGSSFHWTDSEKALQEFNRILKVGGGFTAIWNPRDIYRSELHTRIEEKIYNICPNIKRVSSGSKDNMNNMERIITSHRNLGELIFIEKSYDIIMSKERFIGAWESVNDIQVQAGKEKFDMIINMIREEIEELDEILVPYKTRAWTVKKLL
ncbi:methylase involved in ubiquinone/menaquinone biosynthesis [Clostridium carnis]|uniref:Methylase involved in ubiquinone/menaquinone biosynthesis n=1 Tax=Clostridium carnis TaxID=1530 RepID=A0ABY6SW17_9CLOT|nr:methyltransferase domain-containing protein [Clostridium carnis]VDG72431.1 methylase involved in ubiquinone/menaquinone biosynthesis [Clostridium carnis]